MPMDDELQGALSSLAGVLKESPARAGKFYETWRFGPKKDSDLKATELDALAKADAGLSAWTAEAAQADLEAALGEHGKVILIWVDASGGREDVTLAPLLEAAQATEEFRDHARIGARSRIVQGPLQDAIACVPLLGNPQEFRAPENFEARARLEILVWEAGARGLELPEFGKFVFASSEMFDAVIGAPARGSLRGRVLAARALEVTASAIPPHTDPQLIGQTLQVLQPLLLHPEPLVWVHAARAFGRLAGVFEPLEGTLLDWVHRANYVLRQRALTAFCSLPSMRLALLGHELESILDDPKEEAWGLAAAAAATPYLFHERRDLWDSLAQRILAGDGGAVAARALARGIATLWRRRAPRGPLVEPFGKLRLMARRVRTDEVDDLRRWLEITQVTDPFDSAERDPLDIETGLENLVRLASQYDDLEGDARAARFAATLGPTFTEAKRIVLGEGSNRQRAAAINAIEGCARSLALRLWGPMLATRPEGNYIEEPDLEETWEALAKAPAELLDIVRERRLDDVPDESFELALEILAIKLGGYALDACGREQDLGPGPGRAAHDTCLWLRKIEGLTDGSRELPPALQTALSGLFWRLVDTTRGTALGEVDDVAWLGPFAAWWALVIDRPAILQQLATALPMIADGALENCCKLGDDLRGALGGEMEDGAWGEQSARILGELQAGDTELAEALEGLSKALTGFADAAGPKPDLEPKCLELVLAAERLQHALADPVRALHPASESPPDDSLNTQVSENAPRMATVVMRAIRQREIALLDVWFASLGPTASKLVEASVQQAIKRTPPPPPVKKKKQPKMVLGYELIKALGEGGIGSVWLVRKPGADRYFVLKIPKADVLASASDTEREGILASFTEEAKALAGLYHPNVANIIDRGVTEGMPYLVLEYLIGADLKMYSTPQLMTLFELRKVVQESCAGLTALHNAGLVHRDIKPANLWLRLPLQGGVRFDPEKHRDPAMATPLSTVLIDFGMVRAQKVSAEVGGRFVAGTPGYIAPEQVLDPVELDGRADLYALAGTIYNVTTGRTFFDEITDKRERILAHMKRDPMEDDSRFADYPAALVKLMRAATAMNWKDRPTPLEFGREFAALL